MGRDLTYEKLQKHSDFFAERLQGLPGRLASTYSIYRYFAHEVRTYKCTDSNILCAASFILRHSGPGSVLVFIYFVILLYFALRSIHFLAGGGGGGGGGPEELMSNSMLKLGTPKRKVDKNL